MTGKKKRQNRKETPSSSPSFMHLKRQRKLPTTFPLLHLQKYDTPRRQISPFTPSSILRSFPPKETPRDRDRDKDRSLTSTICHSPRSLPEYMNEEEEKQDWMKKTKKHQMGKGKRKRNEKETETGSPPPSPCSVFKYMKEKEKNRTEKELRDRNKLPASFPMLRLQI